MNKSIVRIVGAMFVAAAMVATFAAVASAGDGPGRYKKEGNKCVWNATDDGPNQCTPVVVGHFKGTAQACTWVSQNGADQCQPAKGRFKVDGKRCYWDAKDDGPNQCDPRKAK